MRRSPPATDARAPEGPDLSGLVGVKLGNYRLERLIGHGRMGFVYLAKDEALLRPTAIKVLSWRVADAAGQDPVQWFLAEARLVARINHPRVVQIYGAARQGDYCYIAMEYVAGASAEAVVERGRMVPEKATDVLLQAASALHAAHRSGIVHRDVKPANLLMGEGGVTKLGDFGMALCPADLRIGNAHLRVGTPYYTAPEIWVGEPAIAASDIYSLGATYFHLLTGRPPYPGADVASVEHGHLRAPIPDPRDLVPRLPASCAELVRRVLAKAPRDRHASAQLLLWDARRVLQDLTSALEPTVPRRPDPSPAPPAEPAAVRDPGAPTLPAAEGPLAEVLGFARRPFCGADATANAPALAPLAATRRRLLDLALDGDTPAIVVTGDEGSGRAALCRGVAAELGRTRLVLHVQASVEAGAPLLQRLCRAAGVPEEPTEEATLDAFIERLAEERHQRRPAPIVVLDGVAATQPPAPALARIVGAGLWTRSFKTVIAGAPGLVEALARSGVDLARERVAEIAVRPLERDRIPGYVRSWIEATLAPRAPPLIFSPDALLLLALRSEGGLERVDCIAENMLVLAASERRRTVTSWHAWAASDRERWSGTRAPADLPRRPEGWPPPDVADVIDACRRGAGMSPWPRGSSNGAKP